MSTDWIPQCDRPLADGRPCSLLDGHAGECSDFIGAVNAAPHGPLVPIPGHPGCYTQAVDLSA